MTELSHASFSMRRCLLWVIRISCPILVLIIKHVKGCSPSPVISKHFFLLMTWLCNMTACGPCGGGGGGMCFRCQRNDNDLGLKGACGRVLSLEV